MVTTKQETTIDTQKIKKKESKHATLENHEVRKEGSKRGKMK